MRDVGAERTGARAYPVVVVAGARAGLALTCALAVGLVWAPADESEPQGESLPGALFAYVLEDGAVRPLEDGAALPPGARVQLAYRVFSKAPSRGPDEDAVLSPLGIHAVIFSVDERGRRTLHFPHHERASTLLERAEGVLPSSFELDATPGSERFFLVLAARPLSAAEVLARRTPSNPSFSLRKRVH